ncbi:fatty acid--CoA ligase [Streptomyces sp. JV185]|uniref:fatty acid--CoA ligase n=1 Tax=Streptomyces sp. JV185 TaxID=858638 RepID=UPI002E75F3FF|nr:fatty acid--CoA ligase [Streptomyces sp. JV185]MEE1772805.1 fatty acid--CoA ligase [Streptomyces sp. JV185]
MYYPNLRTAADTVAFHATHHPRRTAVNCEGREVTYEQLHRESNRSARALLAAGAGRGSRVAYLGKESEDYYEIFFACAKTGAVLVPINWRLSPGEVEHILRDSGAELLFVEEEYAEIAARIRAELPARPVIVELDGGSVRGAGFREWKAGLPDHGLAVEAAPDDPVTQIYTSGTTGLPKGVVLAHRSFFAIRDLLAEHGLDWIDWRPQDISLISIPGFHVAGIWWAMQAFNAGVTSVAMRMFTPHDAVRLIRELGVTTTCAVPSMLQMMVSERGVGPADFASLRKVTYGGSPISETLMLQCMEVLGCQLGQLYGLTESGNTALCLPPADHRPGSPRLRAAGRPYPGVSVQVVDEKGGVLEPGAVGEICLRTPAAMLEYWNMKEATEETLADGWLHTGDAGYLDEDGYVYVCDRLKDTVIVAGENVYPAEVENALCTHPAVAEAAVIGVPDERWGEAVRAFVVLRPEKSATPRELKLHLQGRLADFKSPSGYEFIERIPRNPSGKILRRELRKDFWAERERQVN